MAERGAHLTQTALQKPSIFEVVAQQTLSSTIQPALKRIVEFLGSSNPDKYGWLEKWFEEVYLAFNFILQNHYLTHHDGSFSEIFYGMCRFCCKGQEDTLNKRGKMFSLLQVVIIPYIWQKIDKAIQKLYDEASESYSVGKRKGLTNFILKIHKLSRMAWESTILVYYLTYLGGKTRSHSPLFHLFGLGLRYSEENEMVSAWEDASNRKGWFSPKQIGQNFLRLLEVGAFTLQFFQWWQTEQNTTDVTALPVPSPPKQLDEDTNVNRICPLCHRSWRIETLLPVSGYVFCFRCIMQYVHKHRSCPITGYPASAHDLVRLYK